MSTTSNTINLMGKEYPYRFGIKFQRVFMNRYKLKKVDAFQKKIGSIGAGTLESLEVIGAIVLCAIQAASKKPVNIDPDDIIDFINTPEGQQEFLKMQEALTGAQPDEDETQDVGKSKQ